MTPFAAWPSCAEERGAVTVYGGSVEAAAPALDRLGSLLSEDESARAARFAFERDRRAYVAAHGMLREVLGARVGAAPETLHFETGDRGKPVLVHPRSDLAFNLSHAGDAVAVAAADRLRLGVDVELLDARVEHEHLARRFFTAAESAAIRARSEPDRLHAFYRCWTRKEAIVKAAGGGLSIALDSFEVDVDARHQAVAAGNDRWWLRDLDPGEGYAAAVAASADVAVVRIRWSPAP